jgi:hypothetical protein
MKQFSTDNKPVELELLSGHLLFVDLLYFQDIIDGLSQIDKSSLTDQREFVMHLEEKLFPFGEGGLLGYKFIEKRTDNYLFDPKSLKKWDDGKAEQKLLAQQKQNTTFSVDSASFLIIDLTNFEKLIQHITFESLIDAFLEAKLDNYFEEVNNKLGNKGWAYVVSEGVATNTEFDGDGSYIVD